MRKILLSIVAISLLASCGGAETSKGDRKDEKYDPYNPVKNYDPNKNTEVVENRNMIPGEGSIVMKSTTAIEVLDLPGSPVLISDSQFNALFGASSRQGGKKLLELLKSRKIESLDHVIIPSVNPETFEGLSELIGNIGIMSIDTLQGVDSEALRAVNKLAFDKMVFSTPALAGSKWVSNGVLFEVLYPMTGDIATGNPAMQTCVLRIEKDGVSALFTGDAGAEAEKLMLERGKLKPTTYLVATNGAPKDCLSVEFVNALDPREVVVGKRSVEPRSVPVKTQSVAKDGAIRIVLGKATER